MRSTGHQWMWTTSEYTKEMNQDITSWIQATIGHSIKVNALLSVLSRLLIR